MPILSAFIASFLESVLSFSGATAVFFTGRFFTDITHRVIGFAIGALLGVAFFDVLPEAIGEIGVQAGLTAALAGIFLFFIIERFFRWYHVDEDDFAVQPYTRLILVGGFMHNAIDGVTVGLSFLVSFELGIATTIAILIHEIPHGIADFSALTRGGYTRLRAYVMSFLVSMSTVPTAVLTAAAGPVLEPYIPYILGLVGGNFLYLALADLLPETHEEKGTEHFLMQSVLMIGGAALMFFVGKFFAE